MAKSKLRKSPLEEYFGSGDSMQLSSAPRKIVFTEKDAITAKKSIEDSYNRKKVNWEKLRRVRFEV